MSSNLSLPAILQLRSRTYCAAFLDNMEGKRYFNGSSLSQFGRCERIKVVCFRILSVLGACFFAARDLKVWICSSREVVALVGLQFHLANLISILAFPFIAMAAMPFGLLPIPSYTVSLKGAVRPMDAFAHKSENERIMVEHATRLLKRMIADKIPLTPDFFIEVIRKGYTHVITAFLNLEVNHKYHILLQTIHRSLDKEIAEKVVLTIARTVNSPFIPNLSISNHAMIHSMQAMDEDAVDSLLEMGIGPSNHAKTPFVYLILGGDEFYIANYPRKKAPRTLKKTIAIAMKCIARYGAFNKLEFDELIKFKDNYLQWTPYLLQGAIGHNNSYLTVLKESRVGAFLSSQNLNEAGKFHKRITELEPHIEIMQSLQLSSHISKHKNIIDTCKVLPAALVNLILQYCLQYTYEGVAALEAESKSAIQIAQKSALDAIAKQDVVADEETLTKLEPEQKVFRARQLMVRYMKTLNMDGVDMVIRQGFDPCSTNPRNIKAKITPFEHLILGVEDLKTYPMKKNARDIDVVVAIAKRCIECSGSLNMQFISQLLKFKDMSWDEVRTLSKGTENPYCRLLQHTKLIKAPVDERMQMLAEFQKRIRENEPHLMDLQIHQITTFAKKHNLVSETCMGETCERIPRQFVTLILQYALRYSAEDERICRATTLGTGRRKRYFDNFSETLKLLVKDAYTQEQYDKICDMAIDEIHNATKADLKYGGIIIKEQELQEKMGEINISGVDAVLVRRALEEGILKLKVREGNPFNMFVPPYDASNPGYRAYNVTIVMPQDRQDPMYHLYYDFFVKYFVLSGATYQPQHFNALCDSLLRIIPAVYKKVAKEDDKRVRALRFKIEILDDFSKGYSKDSAAYMVLEAVLNDNNPLHQL